MVLLLYPDLLFSLYSDLIILYIFNDVHTLPYIYPRHNAVGAAGLYFLYTGLSDLGTANTKDFPNL